MICCTFIFHSRCVASALSPLTRNAVRLALRLGNVSFEDKRFPLTDAVQGQQEFLVDGASYTQPDAMLRCAGRLSGSYPVSSPMVTLQIDEIIHALSEVQAKMNCHAALESSTLSHYVSLIEGRLQRLRQVPVFKFYNDRVLIHEIAVYCWVKSLQEMQVSWIIDYHKCIGEVEAKVESQLKVKQQTHQKSWSPKMKLTYFPFPGRAEPIRLALFIAGIPFDDERIGLDELNRRRSTLPFNQLPVLEVEGDVTSQALGILRYVGTLGGLYSPTDTKEALRIDELFSRIDEFYSSYVWNASYFEVDPEKQLKLRTRLAEETLPTTLRFLEERVSRWSRRYAVGDRLTIGDLAIYSLLWTFQSGRILGVPVSVVSSYKSLLCICDGVASNSKVIQWCSMHQLS
ncbi:Glutathione S-transferase [Phytophthora megakarya]|uniref:Glutathione S-transferase n=1 Tax=Phytophthora megakarya TaxID=4795 RepID=A0A225V594_9STRA|nr:Glutathione S-transferase [Phytophthora megakarya]